MKTRALVVVVLGVLLGGCSAPSPFDSSVGSIAPKYESDAVVEGKFLDQIHNSPEYTGEISDEMMIRYGKSICTLLDETDESERIVKEYRDEDAIVSDAAIDHFCPHHLD